MPIIEAQKLKSGNGWSRISRGKDYYDGEVVGEKATAGEAKVTHQDHADTGVHTRKEPTILLENLLH